MEFFGFFIFLSVVWYCDHKQYMTGYTALFFKDTTPEDKVARKHHTEQSQCQSCQKGFDGTSGNGYQPCGCDNINNT